MTTERMPDSEVVVKLSTCQKCDGIITAAVKHMMGAKEKREFAKEVMEHNLKVTEIPLLEYRIDKQKWCKC